MKENWYALYLSIVREYSINKALLAVLGRAEKGVKA